ncbi:MAG: YkgJ family cysteine cluster protein [Bacillota bacterium]
MTNIFGRDFSDLDGIFKRPETLNSFARQKMLELNYILKDSHIYNCPPACKHCCYGSILMSYTEFSAITLYLQENWSPEQVRELMTQQVGLAKDDGMLLCPFLHTEAKREHCSIYPVRPLICRVFGTTAAPCEEEIVPMPLADELFHLGYRLLYYSGNRFIALNLNAELALFEAPFALWCLADNSETDRRFLCNYLENNGDSLRAVLFDRIRNVFFSLHQGERILLSGKYTSERNDGDEKQFLRRGRGQYGSENRCNRYF